MVRTSRCTISSAMPATSGMAGETTWNWIHSCNRLTFSESAGLAPTANTPDRVSVYLHRKPLRLSLPDLLHEKTPMGACHGGERSLAAGANPFTGNFGAAVCAGSPAHSKRTRGHP